MLVAEILVGLKLAAVKLVAFKVTKKPLVELMLLPGVPLAVAKVTSPAKLVGPETYKLVEVMLVAERSAIVVLPRRLAVSETYNLVVVRPMPSMVKPPKIVVETLVAPILTLPMVPPVPMATVVVPIPVAILTVEVGPIPRLRVCGAVELPMVMAPVPAVLPIVKVPAMPPFGIMVETTSPVLVTLVALM